MNLPKIVCPHRQELWSGLHGCEIAVVVDDVAKAARAAADVRNSGNTLFCVIVESSLPLDQITFGQELENIPLALRAPSMGQFRDLRSQVDRLRGLNLRVYLPCHPAENLAALKVLSSLGVHTCAVFEDGYHDWDTLADLMTYAVLGRAAHAPIEPFSFIASHYDRNQWLDWGRIYFDDPRHFLHVDAEGRVALSAAELRAGQFVASNLADLATAADCPAMRERSQAWKSFFGDFHPCACCPAWKVCMGRFAESALRDRACSGFFVEMMDVARQHAKLNAPVEDRAIWQP
jgi:hypothetical protein